MEEMLRNKKFTEKNVELIKYVLEDIDISRCL
jgi:hypothetical protein